MEFTLTIAGTVTPDLAPVLLGLTGGSIATTAATTKAVKKTEPAASAAPASASSTATDSTQTGSAEKLTIEEVRELATAKADHNLPAIKALFKEFGVKRAVDLQPEQYADFYAKVKAL